MRGRVLVVDDEENVRISLQGILQDEGYQVECVSDGEGCFDYLERNPADVILLDIWLPGLDGIETLRNIRERFVQPYVVMISGHGSIKSAVQATKLGAFDFLEKPLSLDKVVRVVKHALRQKRLEEENESLRDFLKREVAMVGSSVPMQALRQQIGFAAPTEGRILIFGENGTGKELVARLLHLGSKRAKRSFVEVNCAAIPDDLIESELFGSVKGAFTGAAEGRKGKFELADSGTLFLDEVGDMSLKTQAKVLRVLEKQRFYRVGSNEPVDVDLRVIAATNKRLEDEIEKGSFRQDLFFRLNVIPFEVPPLRERREDIPELSDFFIELFCRRYGKQGKTLQPESIERLMQYHWPGNIRELKNTIERLVIMLPGDSIGPLELPSSILKNAVAPDPSIQSFQKARERFEREFLWDKLIENGGNVSKTASAIGIERTHLHRKLKSYGIRIK